MARFIQFYLDSACKTLWKSVPVAEVQYSRVDAPPSTITIGSKSYRIFDGYSKRFRDVLQPVTATPFDSSKNPFPFTTHLYCKNGFSVDLIFRNSPDNYAQFQNAQAQGVQLSENTNVMGGNSAVKMYLVSLTYNDVEYIGFTNPSTEWTGVVWPKVLIESSFWEAAVRPPYDYGTKPDGNGGQGDGKIPHTPVGFSTKPTISLPTGDYGLHAYKITRGAYDSLQSYLWGQGSTLAKNLWQKFINSKTNPAGCIVACYRLPKVFMPSGTVTNGIKLAGVKAPINNGVVQIVELGFIDYAVYVGHVDAPFSSWADYCGTNITVSIPLCGEFTASPEKVWGKDVFVKYRVDLSNGNLVGMACTGTCAEDGSSYSMEYILGEMSGNVAYNVPISGGDDGTLARIGAVVGGIGNVVSGFVGGVQDLSSVVGTMGATAQSGSPIAGNAGFSSLSRTSGMSGRGAHYLSDIVMPPFQSHLINPNLSGNISACSNGIAYVEYQIARIAYPSNYGDVMGYPARSSGGLLRDFTSGYGEFYVSADFDIHGATYEEKEEIVSLLESGVFV